MPERRSESADELGRASIERATSEALSEPATGAEPFEAASAVPASVARAHELAEPAAFDEIADPALRRVLRAYLVRGRLPVLPRGGSKRTLLLEYLATAFEPGVRYREVEVNQTVAVWNPDVAALRRYLVDAGLLARENGLYWRCGGWV